MESYRRDLSKNVSKHMPTSKTYQRPLFWFHIENRYNITENGGFPTWS